MDVKRNIFLASCFLIFVAMALKLPADSSDDPAEKLISTTGMASNVGPGAAASDFAGLKLAANLLSRPVNRADRTILQGLLNTIQYYVTPGDIYQFILIVNHTISYSYTISIQADHTLQVPILGAMDTERMTYLQLREKIIGTLTERMPLDFIDFYMLTPATFEVFISGQVINPGPYVSNSLVRVGEALTMAGGLMPQASYRKIEIHNPAFPTSTIDLFKYSGTGEDQFNPFLRQGDFIVVPSADKQVSISGEVARPAVYELFDGETIKDLLRFSGGLTKEANQQELQVRRIESDGAFTVFDIDLSKDDSFVPIHGDRIQAMPKTLNARYITVEGALFGKPRDGKSPVQLPQANLDTWSAANGSASPSAAYAPFLNSVPVPIKVNLPYYPGINLWSVLWALGGPTEFAVSDQSVIFRKSPQTSIPFDVEDVWRNPDKGKAIEILPDDYVLVPMATQVVVMAGEVNAPRILPLSYKRSLQDYLLLSGGIKSDGDAGAIWLYDGLGNRIRLVGLDYEPKAGDVIAVDKAFGARVYDFVTTSLPFFTAVAGSIITLSEIIRILLGYK